MSGLICAGAGTWHAVARARMAQHAARNTTTPQRGGGATCAMVSRAGAGELGGCGVERGGAREGGQRPREDRFPPPPPTHTPTTRTTRDPARHARLSTHPRYALMPGNTRISAVRPANCTVTEVDAIVARRHGEARDAEPDLVAWSAAGWQRGWGTQQGNTGGHEPVSGARRLPRGARQRIAPTGPHHDATLEKIVRARRTPGAVARLCRRPALLSHSPSG